MTHRKLLLPTITAGVFALSVAAVAHGQELDVTMEVVEDNGTEETLVNRLELPETASEQGRESSSAGLDTANEARERGREFGQSQAAEARERGDQARETARERSEEARETARERGSEASQQRGRPAD